MKLLFVLLLISTTAMCQKVDTLKIPEAQAKKIEAVEKQLKELEAVKQQIAALELIKVQLIEAAFEYSGKPVPKDKAYQKCVILYIKDKE